MITKQRWTAEKIKQQIKLMPPQAAWRTHLLEENREPLAISGAGVHLSVRPFQIVSLRLEPKTT